MIKRQRIIIILGLALAFTGGFLTNGFLAIQPAQAPSSETQELRPSATASLMVDFGDGTLKTYLNLQIQPGETLLGVLQRTAAANNLELATKDYKDLGSLVTKIGSKENGTGKRYWQYWVNNQHPPVGASAYKVQPNDVIEWKFIGEQAE